MATPLSEKMRAIADRGHARASELREMADKFDVACGASLRDARFLGAWARARKLWCECIGEPLV